MKLKTIASLLLLPAISASAGTVKNLSMPSTILGEDKTYTIYLPDGYEDSGSSYPVLYLLHGAWGNDRDWTEKGSADEIADLAIRNSQATPMIIVMPDARGTDPNFAGPHMGYFNQDGWNYEDFFYQEFIPYIENNYRVAAGKKNRAIAGLSMGGGGSVAYGQNYPDYWGSVCSLSGAVGNFASADNADGLEVSRKGMSRYDQVRFVENATPEQLEALKTIRWYVDCGDDDFLADSNVALYTAMKHKGIPLEYRMRDGAHNWTYWRTALPSVLGFVSAGFLQP